MSEMIKSHIVAQMLKTDLKLKRRIPTNVVDGYAKQMDVYGKRIATNGSFHYYWTKEQYEKLKEIYNE